MLFGNQQHNLFNLRGTRPTNLEEELEEGCVQIGVKDREEGSPPLLCIPDAGLLVVTGQSFAQPY